MNSIDNKFFIEIGTSNFNTLSCLAEQGWSGIFIEPDNWYLSKLKRFENCIYENCAILDFNGTTKFLNYDADWVEKNKTNENKWISGTGTTDLNVNNMNTNPNWPTVSFDVTVKTLNKIIEEHNINQIDFLKIDTEGSDTKVLYAFDFKIRPSKIKMEIAHLKEHGHDFTKFKNFMLKKNYSAYYEVDYDPQDIWFFDNLK